MRVIPNTYGWDIALDIAFTEREIAEGVAAHIQSAVHALVRDAVAELVRDAHDRSGQRRDFRRSGWTAVE